MNRMVPLDGNFSITRRVWLHGCLLTLTSAPAMAAAPKMRAIAPRIHVLEAINEEPRPANRGRVVNTAVIAGNRDAVIIDPGPSFLAGRVVRDWVENNLGLKMAGVVNTHAHPENVLGNAAFADIPIYAVAETKQLMASRCKQCLARLTRLLGTKALHGTRIVLPNRTVPPQGTVRIGSVEFEAETFFNAHSANDLALFHRDSGTLFCGGLAYRARIPEMQEASIVGWLRALHAMGSWPIQFVVGAGCGLPAETLEPTRAYLSALANRIAPWIRSGGEVSTVPTESTAPWSRWEGFSERHPLNIQHAWRELEAMWWSGTLPDHWD